MAEAHTPRILIVGAGAAGLMAALGAAKRGLATTVLEANPRPGAKIRISGGGRCNVTHQGGARAVLAGYPKAQARFLGEALRVFPPEALLELLERHGIHTEARADGRIFPIGGPGTGALVVEALREEACRAGARIQTGLRVAGMERDGDRIAALRLEDGRRMAAEAFILATGGASYPETGTRGEALGWLRALELPVRAWHPALAPIPLQQPHPAWEGVALRNGTLRLSREAGSRRVAEWPGDIVFTRKGISGPAALALSEAAEALRREGLGWLTYGTSTGTPEGFEAELVALQASNPHLAGRTWLHRHLPERLSEDLWNLWEVDPNQRLRDLPKALRRRMAEAACDLALGAPGPVDLGRGEVSAGGLALSALDPGTCRVKAFSNLHVCGELLDVNGPVGGYNLQAAFSTGFLAGSRALANLGSS